MPGQAVRLRPLTSCLYYNRLRRIFQPFATKKCKNFLCIFWYSPQKAKKRGKTPRACPPLYKKLPPPSISWLPCEKAVGTVAQPWLPCAKRTDTTSPTPGSLVQRELSAQLTEGLSARVSFFFIENGLSYPLRHFVTPPLTIRGGMGWGHLPFPKGEARRESFAPLPFQKGDIVDRCDTFPDYKGRHGRVQHLLTTREDGEKEHSLTTREAWKKG